MLALAVVAGGPVLRALVGTGGAATPTSTQLAVQPTPTPQVTTSPPATASPTPGPTPSPSPEPTETPSPPPGGTPFPTPHVYIVRSGDTLWQIAMTYDLPLSQLIDANPQIKDPSVILPGEQVNIPAPKKSP
jgi:spore coat assembly protein SafA